MTDQHAGIVCRRHQPNRAKGSREGTSSRFILPCRVQGQRPCWGQGAKPLGSSNALVTRTAAGGIAANPDKSAQGCRTLPTASCRLRRAVQSCNRTQGDGSHPHTQARRRQSAERTEAPSSGCASIPPAHSESAAQHPLSAHFRRAKLARTPPALGKQPEYSPAEGTARVETVGIRGSRTGAVLGTAQSQSASPHAVTPTSRNRPFASSGKPPTYSATHARRCHSRPLARIRGNKTPFCVGGQDGQGGLDGQGACGGMGRQQFGR